MLNAAQAQEGGSFVPLLLIVALFGVMYFMMIRPQQKRRKEAQAMQSALGPGDEIVTIGGLHGTVVAVDDEVVTLELSPGVTARYARPAVARVLKQQERPEAVAEEPVPPAADPVQSPVIETKKQD